MKRHGVEDIVERVKGDPDECWVWPSVNSHGYGATSISRRHVLVHRVVYTHLVGPVPPGLELDHLCRNRACANPSHLEPVTHSENMRRSMRGFAFTGKCQAGLHEISGPVDIYTYGSGSQACRACGVERARERSALIKRAKEALNLTHPEYRARYGSSAATARKVLEEIGE